MPKEQEGRGIIHAERIAYIKVWKGKRVLHIERTTSSLVLLKHNLEEEWQAMSLKRSQGSDHEGPYVVC